MFYGVLKDISCDITSANWSTPRALQDVTGLCKSAHERIVLLADFNLTLNGAGLNFDVDRAHDVLSSIVETDIPRTVEMELPAGTDLLNVECTFSEYNVVRGADGGMTWSATATIYSGDPVTYL